LLAYRPQKEVILQEYPIGSLHTGVVTTNREHEVFVNLGQNIKGCIPKGLREGGSPPDDLSDGVEVQVIVKEFSEQHGRLTLIFAEPESLQSAGDLGQRES
jgi:ribosomal protein S1